MERLQHFKIEKNQLRSAYAMYIDSIEKSLSSLEEDYDDEHHTLQCGYNSKVRLVKEPLGASKEIKNPFVTTVEVAHPPIEDKRITYIVTILEVIEMEIENEKLQKLIQVIDLVNVNQGETKLQDILNLK